MPYTRICPHCGAENVENVAPAPGERRFCSQCGARLDVPEVAAPEISGSQSGDVIFGRVLQEFRGIFGKSKRRSSKPTPSSGARRQPRTSILVESPPANETSVHQQPGPGARATAVPISPPRAEPSPPLIGPPGSEMGASSAPGSRVTAVPTAPPRTEAAAGSVGLPVATGAGPVPGFSAAGPPAASPRVVAQAAGGGIPSPGGVPFAASGGPLKPFTPGAIFAQRYQILTTRELSYSVFYDAVDLRCPNAGCASMQPQAPQSGLCSRCSSPLDTVLIHERRATAEGRPPPEEGVLALGRAGHPDILVHRETLTFQQAVYTVVEHPGRWGVLARGRRVRSPEDALMMLAPVGRVLIYLHQQGFGFTPATASFMENLERLVTSGGDGAVKVADLSAGRQFTGRDGGRAEVARDIMFLGQMLGYLTTGTVPIGGALEAIPAEHREVVAAALQGQYPTVAAMLVGLSMAPLPEVGRPLKAIHGQATDPGRKHARNEDSVVTFTFDKAQQGGAVPIGFYMVADGMGGHDAGDVASRMVYQVVTEWILKSKVLPDLRKETRKLTTENIPGNLLKEAIQAANKVLVRHSSAQQSNMGSTITTALVIGNVATLANVGDSRTYLLRDGQLRQITQDHSLVARLVQAHVIAPDQVRSHPQRNQIFRSLGQQESVEVDTFTVLLSRGDQLILCSDGLWEMVLDAEIQRIIETHRSPQQACDALITAANAAGGEDNISAIVVAME